MQLFIKTGFIAAVLSVLFSGSAVGQSRYVTDDLTITLRTGAGQDRKIIAMIPSGRVVDIVSAGEEWTEVQYDNKQGWVLTRYLTDKVPATLTLERLQKEYNALVAKHLEVEQQFFKLTDQNKSLSGDLNQAQTDLEQLSRTYESLKNESTEYLKLKSKYENVVKEMSAVKTKAGEIESAYNKVSNNQLHKGLLYGGGLLFSGLILGFILKRPKRRSPLM